jgi:thiol-disulfide isomerase/thioredoxin
MFSSSSSSSSHVAAVIILLITLASIASLTESFSAVSFTRRGNNIKSDYCSSSPSSSLHAFANPLRRRQRPSPSSSGDTKEENTKENKKDDKSNKRRSNNVQHITEISDYKRIVVDETHNITVVRFYSHFCRSCRASEPHFFKLARDFQAQNVNFVEVPLTPSTKVLHDALGVPSLPWTHIYHPEAGLVEERKVSKKFIEEVRSALRCYVYGECDLEDAPADCMQIYGECAIDDFDDDDGGG